jgi:hypothetical protein
MQLKETDNIIKEVAKKMTAKRRSNRTSNARQIDD